MNAVYQRLRKYEYGKVVKTKITRKLWEDRKRYRDVRGLEETLAD